MFIFGNYCYFIRCHQAGTTYFEDNGKGQLKVRVYNSCFITYKDFYINVACITVRDS